MGRCRKQKPQAAAAAAGAAAGMQVYHGVCKQVQPLILFETETSYERNMWQHVFVNKHLFYTLPCT
jgi:hypothetical protein